MSWGKFIATVGLFGAYFAVSNKQFVAAFLHSVLLFP